MLSTFLTYDPEVYLHLKSLYQRIGAKIRQTDRKLQFFNSQKQKNLQCLRDQVFSEDSNVSQELEDTNSALNNYNNLCPEHEETNSEEQKNVECLKDKQVLVEANDCFKNCNSNSSLEHNKISSEVHIKEKCLKGEQEFEKNNKFSKIYTISNSKSNHDDSLSESHDGSYKKENINNFNIVPQLPLSSAQKKSKFQLKLPIKAVIDPQASKQLVDIISKNNLSKHYSIEDFSTLSSPKVAIQSVELKKTDQLQGSRQLKKSSSENNFYQSTLNSWVKLGNEKVQDDNYNSKCLEETSVKQKTSLSEIELENGILWSNFVILTYILFL